MKLKPGAVGVIVPARRVPVALQDKVKEELQRIKDQGVVQQVTEPTEWSSYMVTVVKKDKVRICLNPTALNKVLPREQYPMPTLEDVAPRIAGAKFFVSTLDVASGFWQIKLSDSSLKLSMMSTMRSLSLFTHAFRYRFCPRDISGRDAPYARKNAVCCSCHG